VEVHRHNDPHRGLARTFVDLSHHEVVVRLCQLVVARRSQQGCVLLQRQIPPALGSSMPPDGMPRPPPGRRPPCRRWCPAGHRHASGLGQAATARSVSPLQPVELPSITSSSIPPSPAALEHPTDGDGRGRESTVDAQDGSDTNCKSTDSYTSTNSSFFKRYFPRRVFILKSMTTVGFEVFGTRLTSGGARGKCRDRALEDTEAQRADPRYATRNATPLTYQTRRFGRRQRCS
jgi:hypothetical protein